MRLPGVDGLRVPARFWMMSLVCLSVRRGVRRPPGDGAPEEDHRRHRRSRPAARRLAANIPRVRPPRAPADARGRGRAPRFTDDGRSERGCAVSADVRPAFQPTTATAATSPPHDYAMRVLLEAGDPRILPAMASRGPLGVVIDRDADTGGRMRTPVGRLSRRAAAGRSPRLEQLSTARRCRRATCCRMNRATAFPSNRSTHFPSAPHTPRALDGDHRTRWSGGPQNAAADFTIEVERGRVGQVVTDLGEFWTDFPVTLRSTSRPTARSGTRCFSETARCTPTMRRCAIRKRCRSSSRSRATTFASSG